MSNQVYANERNKIQALQGMNAYVMASDITLAGASGNAPSTVPVSGFFSFTENAPSIVLDQTVSGLVGGGQSLLIKNEGMYNIKLVVGLQDPVNPTTVDLDFNIVTQLTRDGSLFNGLEIDRQQYRLVAAGASPGTVGKVINISNTLYLKEGDEITTSVENYSAGQLRLLSNVCQLLVTKIY